MSPHAELVEKLAKELCDAAGEPDFLAESFKHDAEAALRVVYDTLKPLTKLSGGRSWSLETAINTFLREP